MAVASDCEIKYRQLILSKTNLQTKIVLIVPNPVAMADRRKRAARLSVFSNSGLVVAKLGVGLAIGSVSVISEAVHSGVDLIAALIAFVAIRIAARPADRSHSYGHGKFENLSGAVEALLIFVGAGIIIFEASQKFGQGYSTEVAIWGVIVMGFSAAVNFGVSRYLYRVGRETDSVALLADAAHLRTDVVTSLGVFVGLGLVWITGWPWLDPLAALLVALLILKSGWDILLHSVAGLLDASLPLSEEAEINRIIGGFAGRYINFHNLCTRQSGPERHISFHLIVPGQTSVEMAHALCDEIEASLTQAINGAVVNIHIEPDSLCTVVDGLYYCDPAHDRPSRIG